MSKFKKERGITLIALIITIIILVILAAVSIRAITNMKIVDYAINGSQNYVAAGKNENNVLSNVTTSIDDAIDSIVAIQENKSAINYGSKTAETVELGDEISIGTEKTGIEKFLVIKNDGKTITVLPYYNITLDETAPVQSSNASNTRFASSGYIESGGSIDMTNEANLINKYILAYKNTLNSLGAKNVKTRIGLISDLSSLTNEQRNPQGVGKYYLGSARYASGQYEVYHVLANGAKTASGQGNFTSTVSNFLCGVRPLVEISI